MNNKSIKKTINQTQRAKRTRSKLFGTSTRPRLSVFRSNKYIYAQLINDTDAKTLTSASTVKAKEKNNIEAATKAGEAIAAYALKNKIKQAIFDRGSYKYHGQVKAVAEGAKSAGLII